MRLKPKNWEVFQHYKDRSPPWIKLHRDLLTNREYVCLPIASKALAPLMWLLASESKSGEFDASFEELQFRLHISRKEYDDGVKPLIDKGFFEIASGMLASSKQVAIPETERETETEREKKATKVAPPEGVSVSVWKDFLEMRKAKRAPLTESALKLIKKEADKAGWPLEQALQECCARGWQSFKADWVQNKSQDVVRQTTPTPANAFDALQKIRESDKMAVKPPAEILEKMALLRKGVA